jgi:hypothetical protein
MAGSTWNNFNPDPFSAGTGKAGWADANQVLGYNPFQLIGDTYSHLNNAVTNQYRASENAYNPQTDAAGQNSLNLQALLGQQISSGQDPAAAAAANRGMAQNASLLGSLHGTSPAAFMNALQQANAQTQGQAAGIGASNELAREQLLGQTANQMYGQGLGYRANEQATNASITNQNAQNSQKLLGGLMNGAGSVLGAIFGYDGGEIDYRARGGGVPGQARVAGDSPRNDTIPAKLSPGEIVLPRSVAQHPEAPERAAAFVEAIKASGTKKPDPATFSAVLAKHRELEGRLRRLEAFAEGGAVEDKDSSTWSAIKSLFRSSSDKASDSQDFAEKANAALPDDLSARNAVLRKRKQLSDLDAATKED